MRTRHLFAGLCSLALLVSAPLLAAVTQAKATARAEQKPVTAPATRSAFQERRARLASVKSWGYQLRLISPEEVGNSPFDLVVVDHAISANRRFVREFTPDEIVRMKTRPDGSRRLLIAYLSIGEAERYRFYWKQEWYEPERAPSWLAAANEQWDGNWRARFWEAGWQEHIFTGADTYLARIKAQGFDGIYLDRADVYHELLRERPSARADMVRFIASLSAAARRDDPSFLVVMQNAEELVREKAVREAIDAVAKEDLFYGAVKEAEANPSDMVGGVLANLRSYRRAGGPVLVVEYLHDAARAAIVRRRTQSEGFVLHVAERSLGVLMLAGPDELVRQDAR